MIRRLHPALRGREWAPDPDTHVPLGYVMVAGR